MTRRGVEDKNTRGFPSRTPDRVCNGGAIPVFDHTRSNLLRNEIARGVRRIGETVAYSTGENGLVAVPPEVVNDIRRMDRNCSGNDLAFLVADSRGKAVAFVGVNKGEGDLVVEPLETAEGRFRLSVYCVDLETREATRIQPLSSAENGRARVEPHIYPRQVLAEALQTFPVLAVRVLPPRHSTPHVSR